MKTKMILMAIFVITFSSLVFGFNEEAIAVRALPVDENSTVCPYLGIPECPIASDYSGSKTEYINGKDCPLSGTAECPLIPDCCKNK